MAQIGFVDELERRLARWRTMKLSLSFPALLSVLSLVAIGALARVESPETLFASELPIVVLPMRTSPRARAPETAPEAPAPRPLLETYVETALRAWSCRSRQELAPLDAVARDIVAVVTDPAEAPLFRGDASRARSAILVAAIAWLEGGLLARVMDGSVNDPAWRRSHRSFVRAFSSDDGKAWGLGQVHPEGGIVLTEDGGWTYRALAPAGARAIDGPTMAARPELAFRVVLHMLRASLRRTGGLSAYSGETGAAPKARARLSFAEAWSRAHPFGAS
jgi:hypothetical protein